MNCVRCVQKAEEGRGCLKCFDRFTVFEGGDFLAVYIDTLCFGVVRGNLSGIPQYNEAVCGV